MFDDDDDDDDDEDDDRDSRQNMPVWNANHSRQVALSRLEYDYRIGVHFSKEK